MDKFDDTKLGTGYHGLLKYMTNRYAYVNRKLPDRKRRPIGPRARCGYKRRKKLKSKDEYVNKICIFCDLVKNLFFHG